MSISLSKSPSGSGRSQIRFPDLFVPSILNATCTPFSLHFSITLHPKDEVFLLGWDVPMLLLVRSCRYDVALEGVGIFRLSGADYADEHGFLKSLEIKDK